MSINEYFPKIIFKISKGIGKYTFSELLKIAFNIIYRKINYFLIKRSNLGKPSNLVGDEFIGFKLNMEIFFNDKNQINYIEELRNEKVKSTIINQREKLLKHSFNIFANTEEQAIR